MSPCTLHMQLDCLRNCLSHAVVAQPCAAHMTTPDMAPNITSLTGQEAVDALAAIVLSSAQQCVTLPGYGFNGSQGVR